MGNDSDDEPGPEPDDRRHDAWLSEPSFGDPDAWRCEASSDPDAWRVATDDDESWRGDVHLRNWPEWSAGPEYEMWRKARDEGRGTRGE
jgi:hypothetical protein